MTPDRMHDLAGDPRFIPGVYNYCDRWCELCPLSHRCLNYAMEAELKEDAEKGAAPTRDQAVQEFWDDLHQRFAEVVGKVEDEVEDFEADLNDPELMAEVEAHERQVQRRAARHAPLSNDAQSYAFAVERWFQRVKPLFQARGVDPDEVGSPVIGRPVDEAEEIRSMIDVIHWYLHFIHVKLARAIGSQAEDELEDDPDLKPSLNDGDGSAKVAMIAMDRSLSAWSALRPRFPEEEGAILGFLQQLARLRKGTERVFPNAHAFVRPGFDEGLSRFEVGAGENNPSD